MGWWSATVLGGDGPLDWLGGLSGQMGVDYSYSDSGDGYYGYAYTRERLESNLDKLVAFIEGDTYDPQVGFQVLGAMLLHVGAAIPDELKEKIIRAATEDAWANEGDNERHGYMDDLVKKVMNSEPGKPVELVVEGLLGKIAEAMS